MFKTPFSFKGRIRRTEYVIGFVLSYFTCFLISKFQDQLIEKDVGINTICATFILYIPPLWFFLAQNTKRCHDRGNSGLFQFIPFYGLWLIFGEGEIGENGYGINPKDDKRKSKLSEMITKISEMMTNTLKKIKSLKITNNINFSNLSSDEIIIISVVSGVIVGLLFGCVFGETIYYHNNGNRGNVKYFDYSEFHLNYISLIASFIITAGITYILLNRKNGEKL